MKTISILAEVLTVITISFTLLISTIDSQLWPRPPPLAPSHFCISQFLVANDACSKLPIDQVRTSPPTPTPPQPSSISINDEEHGHGHHHSQGHHHHEHGHGQGHDGEGNGGQGQGHVHRHGHGHGHRHRHEHEHDEKWQELPVEQDCCKWVQEVDSECVCGMLAYLPVFLAKPLHTYTVIVDSVCNVTFACGARVL